MAPEPHVKYRLVNAKSGTVLDLSGTNQTTISGWENNGGDNQEWYFENDLDNGLAAIKNVRYGKFASFTGAVRDGAPLVGTEERRLWYPRLVKHDLYRIFLPESPFVFELSKDGDKADGTPVVIALEREKEDQYWRLERVL